MHELVSCDSITDSPCIAGRGRHRWEIQMIDVPSYSRPASSWDVVDPLAAGTENPVRT